MPQLFTLKFNPKALSIFFIILATIGSSHSAFAASNCNFGGSSGGLYTLDCVVDSNENYHCTGSIFSIVNVGLGDVPSGMADNCAPRTTDGKTYFHLYVCLPASGNYNSVMSMPKIVSCDDGCAAGHYKTSTTAGNGNTTTIYKCEECDDGYYSAGGTVTSCTQCPSDPDIYVLVTSWSGGSLYADAPAEFRTYGTPKASAADCYLASSVYDDDNGNPLGYSDHVGRFTFKGDCHPYSY